MEKRFATLHKKNQFQLCSTKFMERLKKIIKEKSAIAQSKAKELAPAISLALAVVLVAVIMADILYRPKPSFKRGFEIELATDGKALPKKVEKIVNLADMMKTADATRGEKIFKKCASCHNVNKGEAAKVGPNLFGIIGKARGSSAGFAYSDAMKTKGGSWDNESINQFIAKPKDYLAGTKMAFPGLKKPQDRADVILFLEKHR